jgi:hypothetical protein
VRSEDYSIEALIADVRRLSDEDRFVLRAVIKLLDQAHRGQIANFVRQDIQRILDSPPPKTVPDSKTSAE